MQGIMKKSIFTFAVFSLVVLTSFTTAPTGDDTGDDDTGTPTTTTTQRRDTGGGQNHGGGDKKDIVQPDLPFAPQYPNQEIPSRTKSDF